MTGIWMVGSSDLCDCEHDLDFETPWYLNPVRAWNRRQKALEELSTNPYVVVSDPQLAREAYMKRVEHVTFVSGCIGTIILAAVKKRMSP